MLLIENFQRESRTRVIKNQVPIYYKDFRNLICILLTIVSKKPLLQGFDKAEMQTNKHIVQEFNDKRDSTSVTINGI